MAFSGDGSATGSSSWPRQQLAHFSSLVGLGAWFNTELGVNTDEVATTLNTNLTLVLFLVFAGLSGLAQMNISNLRRRLLN